MHSCVKFSIAVKSLYTAYLNSYCGRIMHWYITDKTKVWIKKTIVIKVFRLIIIQELTGKIASLSTVSVQTVETIYTFLWSDLYKCGKKKPLRTCLLYSRFASRYGIVKPKINASVDKNADWNEWILCIKIEFNTPLLNGELLLSVEWISHRSKTIYFVLFSGG